MKLSKGVRYLILSALALAALIAWRIFSPYSVPSLIGMIGEDAGRLWTQPYFHLGELPVTPALLLKAFLFVLFLAFLTQASRRVIRSRILDYTPLDEGQKFALERGIGYLIFTFGLVVGLQSTGVDFSALAVLGGAVGIGIGFGLQTIAKNFASGLILLMERPIKVGDRVEVDELLGDVVHIGGRSTWIRTNDNVMMIIPNSEFVEKRVTNWTVNDRQARIKVPLGVSYGSDPDYVRQVLLDVAKAHPDVQSTPASDVVFVGFGDSSLDFELRVWTTKQVQTPKVMASDLYFAIFRSFREKGIEIPFPQRDLHLRSVSVPVPIANTA